MPQSVPEAETEPATHMHDVVRPTPCPFDRALHPSVLIPCKSYCIPRRARRPVYRTVGSAVLFDLSYKLSQDAIGTRPQ